MIEKIGQLYSKIEENKKLKLIISGIVFCIGILVALSYIYFFERSEINSDYTDTLLWAYESIKGKSIYNSDFYYAYMLPFGGSLIMGVPALLFGFTYKAHIIGMMMFVMLLSLVLLFFFRMVFGEFIRGLYLAGLSIIAFTCSYSMRLIFYGHIIQYSLGTIMVCTALIILNTYFNKFDSGKKYETSIWIAVILVFSALCMTNGVNIAPFYIAPVLIGVVLEAFFDKKCRYGDAKFCQVVNLSFILLGSTIIGLVINKFLQRNIDSTYVDTLMSFRTTDQWFFSVRELLATWCSLGVGQVSDSLKIASLDGIAAGVMYVFSLMILVIPVVGLCYYSRIESRIIRIQFIAHQVILIVTWLTVSVIQTENIGHEWRWGGAYASAIITSFIFVSWCLDNIDTKRWGIVSSMFFAFACLLVVVGVTKMYRSYGANSLDRVKDVLKENNLTYGYADFWDANAITMLSDDTIQTRAIELDVFEDGQVKSRAVPYRYQTEEDWYLEQDGIDRYFVFLRGSAYEICPPELKGAATENIEIDGGLGYILVYDKNIFVDGECIFDR